MERDPERLSTVAVFYLFAADWLPHDDRDDRDVAVPGGRATMFPAYAHLAGVVLWDLHRRWMADLAVIRPVAAEPVRVMGGASCVQVSLAAGGEPVGRVAGIAARVLELVRTAESPADNELRRLLARLPERDPMPWGSLASWPHTEVAEAGLVRQRGRMRPRIEIADPAAVERVRPRFEELRAAHVAFTGKHPDLHRAVLHDGWCAASWLHPGRGDDL
ncbi:MAG: hypothetical protein AB7V62_06790 [Thermoleophilia bacterium]